MSDYEEEEASCSGASSCDEYEGDAEDVLGYCSLVRMFDRKVAARVLSKVAGHTAVVLDRQMLLFHGGYVRFLFKIWKIEIFH